MMVNDDIDIRADVKRRDILRCARKRFMVEGYAKTGMEAVARDASVSTATLYAYFPSKADLFQHVIDDAAEEFSRLMTNVQAIGGNARETLCTFALAYARFMADPFVRSVFRLVMAERRRFEDTARAFFERGRTDFGAVLMTALERLNATGELRCAKPSWAAGQLMGMIEHPVFFMPLVTGDEAKTSRSLEHIAEDAVETFLARYGHGFGHA